MADQGKDAGIATNAAGILLQGGIKDMMQAVFDAPVLVDHRPEDFGRVGEGAEVVSWLLLLQAILQILNDSPGLSNRQHAKLLGVSEGTVRRAKKLADNPPRRQPVFLSESQFAQLRAEAERQGVSVPELIGQIVNDYLAQGPD